MNAPTAYVDPYGEYFAIVLIPSLFTTVPPAVGAIVGAIVGSGVGLYLGNELSQILFSEDAGTESEDNNPGDCEKGSSDKTDSSKSPSVKPPADLNAPPGPDWVWKGSPDKGAWFNPKTGESLRPHHGGPSNPHDPHWDYIKRPGGVGNEWRYCPQTNTWETK